MRTTSINSETKIFPSPTCPVCRTLVPTAVSMAQAERLRLVFASDGDKLEQHETYVNDLGINAYPYIVSQAFGMSYAVSKLPFAVLIGADGVLRSKGLVNTREHLESLVESMRSGIMDLQCSFTFPWVEIYVNWDGGPERVEAELLHAVVPPENRKGWGSGFDPVKW
jgi:methylamine dehydrogenase accessory protein MauD